MQTIAEFSIRDHGVEHAQYVQGAGVSFTHWKSCYTGCGDSPGEALDDALEQMAMSDEYDPASLPNGWDEGMLTEKESTVSASIESQCDCDECKANAEEENSVNCTHDCSCFENSELHHYVTLYVR